MTVENQSAYSGPYTANGATTAFPFSFIAASATELEVRVDGQAMDPVAYSVSLSADNTGSVTIVPALAFGEVTIHSKPEFTQETSFQRYGPTYPDSFNAPFDRGAIRDIYLLGLALRSLLVEPGQTPPSMDMSGLSNGDVLQFVDGQIKGAPYIPGIDVIVDQIIEQVVEIVGQNATPYPFTATQGQTVFTLPFVPLIKPAVFRLTGRLPQASYTVSGHDVILSEGCNAGDSIEVVTFSPEMPLATPGTPGLMPITDKIKLDGIIDFKADFGGVYDGITNQSAKLQDACDALRSARSGRINLGHYGLLMLGDGLVCPPNIQLVGEFDPQKPRTQWDYLTKCPTAIILPPDKSIIMDGSSLRNCLLWQTNIAQNPTTEAAARTEIAKFDGIAFRASGDDAQLIGCMAIGFDLMAQFVNVFRPVAMGNIFDCNGGIDVSAAYDFGPYGISDNLGQAVYFQYRPWPIDITRRPGTAIYVHDVADGVKVSNNKSFGYQTGLHLRNVFEVEASHIADGPALSTPVESAGTTGIWLDGTLTGCRISGGVHGQEIGWRIEATGEYDIVSGSCGFALQNQLYFGPGARGHIGNMKLMGHTTYPMYAASGVGDWHGSVDIISTANSGAALFLADLADKNRFVDLIRRQHSTTLYDPFPEIWPEHFFADLAAQGYKQGKEVLVVDSLVTSPGSTVSAGGGLNKVKAHLINSDWKVV